MNYKKRLFLRHYTIFDLSNVKYDFLQRNHRWTQPGEFISPEMCYGICAIIEKSKQNDLLLRMPFLNGRCLIDFKIFLKRLWALVYSVQRINVYNWRKIETFCLNFQWNNMTLMCMKSNVLLPTICTFLCTFIAFNLQICLKASFEAMNYKVRGAPFFC